MNITNTTSSGQDIRYTGNDLKAMFVSSLALFEQHVDAINSLNVFPVPDGDTGTNMYLTLRDVVENSDSSDSENVSDMANSMARAALMGAKGNSGVILSQFFKGLAVGLEGLSTFGCLDFVRCLQEAKEYSYKSVGEPVEGTILTVVTAVAEAAQSYDHSEINMTELLGVLCVRAEETVALTPTMLSVLSEAGVVDAGGQGLSVILEGMRRYVLGEEPLASGLMMAMLDGNQIASGTVSHDFLDAVEEEAYGYCTQFLLSGNGLKIDPIRESMVNMGRSVVVVGDEEMLQIHLHADDPGGAISEVIDLGVLSQIKIENMDNQHAEFSEARRRDIVKRPQTTAVVAVALGDGMEVIMANLGVSEVIKGGDTMNPSVGDIVDAITNVPSNDVIVLPNNSNIVVAAEQAASLSNKEVLVVNSKTIPQGISALLSFDPDQPLKSNMENMNKSLGTVRTGEITEAVRSAVIGDISVEPGSVLGILDGEVVFSGDGIPMAVKAILQHAEVTEGDLVTLYKGDPVDDKDVAEVMNEMDSFFDGIELELVDGGQPHYHFVISIE